MVRPKKDGIYLNIKLDKDLYHRLERVSEAAGQTKTLIAERALTAYMDKYEKTLVPDPITVHTRHSSQVCKGTSPNTRSLEQGLDR